MSSGSIRGFPLQNSCLLLLLLLEMTLSTRVEVNCRVARSHLILCSYENIDYCCLKYGYHDKAVFLISSVMGCDMKKNPNGSTLNDTTPCVCCK